MYEFHYDSIKNMVTTQDYYSLTMTTWRMKRVYEDFSEEKEMFDFSYYSGKSKYYNNSNKLVVDKMKDGTCDDAIEKLLGQSVLMYEYVLTHDRW